MCGYPLGILTPCLFRDTTIFLDDFPSSVENHTLIYIPEVDGVIASCAPQDTLMLCCDALSAEHRVLLIPNNRSGIWYAARVQKNFQTFILVFVYVA